MNKKLFVIAVFILGLLGLQQLIAFGNSHVGQLQSQAALVKHHDIDPATLFYTQSDLALKAEKQVRQRLAGIAVISKPDE